MKIKLFTKNVQWVLAHMDVLCVYREILKIFPSDPNIGHHPYGIGVKGKKDISSAVGSLFRKLWQMALFPHSRLQDISMYLTNIGHVVCNILKRAWKGKTYGYTDTENYGGN